MTLEEIKNEFQPYGLFFRHIFFAEFEFEIHAPSRVLRCAKFISN